MSDSRARFALMYYNRTDNLGDEIQSIAARQFLPSVDEFINREELNGFVDSRDERLFVILNGWHCHVPENWPPSPSLIPLCISMHLVPYPVGSAGIQPADHILSGPIAKYIKSWGPVGARDMNTLKLMQKAGLDAYFSACLTLTMVRPIVERRSYVVACDLDDDLYAVLRKATNLPIERVSHKGYNRQAREQRFLRAEELLRVYAGARCVVTTRIHCALPCVGMETPVLFINELGDKERFDGLLQFFYNCRPSELRSGEVGYDFNSPPPNPETFRPYREALISKVNSFVESAKLQEDFPKYPLSQHDENLIQRKLLRVYQTKIIEQQRIILDALKAIS